MILRLMALILISAALTSCFTGVESTPRISVPQKELPAVTAEDTLLSAVRPEPFRLWTPGKQFYVTDNRFKLLLGATAPAGTLTGRLIEFIRYSDSTGPTGQPITRIEFTSEGIGEPMVYTVSASAAALRSRQSVEIPLTVEMSMIDAANRLLKGRTFYILTPVWRDTADRIIDGGRKFVAVTIDSVCPGSTTTPLRLDFTEQASGRRASAFINPDPKARSPRTFANLFSITDPRKRYPDISPENWQLIVDGRIVDGMTRRECRLALGSPADIRRLTNYSIMQERWTYENGVWLLFEDDILIDHRK